MITYDKREFFDGLKKLSEYQVGNKYYFLSNGKLVQGIVQDVSLRIYDHGVTHTVQNKLSVTFEIRLVVGASPCLIDSKRLFNTKEEAAEHFLNENDVPSELLKVLKQEKPKTTVADLIEKLQTVNPELDLEEDYWKILRPISRKVISSTSSLEYWDCDCDTKYIHSVQEDWCPTCERLRDGSPESRIDEIRPENMYHE